MVKIKKTGNNKNVGKNVEESIVPSEDWQLLKMLRIELILFNILLENDLAILQLHIHIYEINTYVHLKTNAL